MWVVFTDKIIYQPWVECSRLNNPMWDYNAMNRHGFFSAGNIWQSPALNETLPVMKPPEAPNLLWFCFIFANRNSPFLCDTSQGKKKRRVQGRYDMASVTTSGRLDGRREEAEYSSTWENHRIRLELLENRRIRLDLLENRKMRTL